MTKSTIPPLPPLIPILPPKTNALLNTQIVQTGPPVLDIVRLRNMSPSEWEDFILDWATSLSLQYSSVRRCGGAGDMGRDIVAELPSSKKPAPWHNFQCKRYDHPLFPADIWLELGKLCYYTYTKQYKVPLKYYFVAPLSVGTTLGDLLTKPDELRDGLLTNWDTYCLNKITTTQSINLDTKLKKHIKSLDFSIFNNLSPAKLLQDYKLTPNYAIRFGGGLNPRPKPPVPPLIPELNESQYLRQLFEAYSQRLNLKIKTDLELKLQPLEYYRHLERSRVQFYSAEALKKFSRDNLPAECFDQLQDEIFDAIADIVDSGHRDGYERILATTSKARDIKLDSHPLNNYLIQQDRAGVCHQLANDSRITWVK